MFAVVASLLFNERDFDRSDEGLETVKVIIAFWQNADVRQSIDAVTTLHERTRLELNEMVSTVSRTGAGFAKALETATTAHMRAAEKSAQELKAAIAQEFAKQNLPALSNCCKRISSVPLFAVGGP